MIEYESFVFLGNHKAGSTFVEEFLDRFCSETKLRGHKHAQPLSHNGRRSGYRKPLPRNAPAEGKPHLISVRDPAALYVSLYNYARTGQGAHRGRLVERGRLHLLDADKDPECFHAWLDSMLDPAQAHLSGAPGFPALAPLFGFWTYRFLRLAMVDGLEKCGRCAVADDVRALYARDSIVDHVLRTERLTDDVRQLFIAPGRFAHAVADQDGARAWLASGATSNDSPPTVSRSWLRPEELDRIYAREWFLAERFGYGRSTATKAA